MANTAAADGRRFALLIGNGDYLLEPLRLRKPATDVAALREPLRRLGFDVQVREDADRATMQAAVGRFAKRASGADMAFFFFAGHGVQLASANYLVATSLPAIQAGQLIEHAFDVREIQTALVSAAPKMGIIIVNTSHDILIQSIPGGEPAIVRPVGPANHDDADLEGLLIAYATDTGEQVAHDQGRVSVFTAALLGTMETQGVTVKHMFRRLKMRLPGDLLSLQEDVLGSHYMHEGPAAAETLTARKEEKNLWERALHTRDVDLIREYERTYPNGVYTSLVKVTIDLIAEPPPPKKPGVDVKDIPVTQKPRVRAALAVLGFYADEDASTPDQTLHIAAERYLSIYRRQRLDIDTLIADAGRQALSSGAALGKGIKDYLRSLRAIEMINAEAVVQLEAAKVTARKHSHPEALLAPLRSDVAEIQSMLEDHRRYLDQTWDRYAQLLERSRLLNLSEPDGGAPVASGEDSKVAASSRLKEYEQLFRRHVQEQRQSKPLGTDHWMDDFRP